MQDDWEVEISFKNLPTYRIPYINLGYVIRASNPGTFSLNVPLSSETMDILRGSEITYLYKGEPKFTGKIVNKVPNFEGGIITLQGLDWNGILFDRQIAFKGYDAQYYAYAGADNWNWSETTPPGLSVAIEGSALIKLILKHYMGKDLDDYFFDISNIEAGLTKKLWRFDGESMGNAFSKIASIMEASAVRFGYHWWIDAVKRFWLKRYGDTIYRKNLMATWGPPSEEISTVVNNIHFLGGIATPFPSNREALTDLVDTGFIEANNSSGNYHKVPTTDTDGWGCYIRNNAGDAGKCVVQSSTLLGWVAGDNETALRVYVEDTTGVDTNHVYSFGVYYKIDDQYSQFKDSLYPNLSLRDWSDRNQDSDRKQHRIKTVTFYYRQERFPGENFNFCGAKLKIYTNSDAPNMESGGGNDTPPQDGSTDLFESKSGLYEIDLKPVFDAYKEKYDIADVTPEFMRISIVCEDGVSDESDTFANNKMDDCAAPAGGGGRYRITAMMGQGGYLEVWAIWDVFTDGTFPDPADIWGIGLEFVVRLRDDAGSSNNAVEFAIDHLFIGFGEIEVQRRDELSIASLDREVTKYIQDRKCHSYDRAEHLADVLLDSLKYAQKSRKGTLSYFNPELQLNQIIPLNEYGVEWQYVLEEIGVDVTDQGVKQTLTVGTPKPDPDNLFDFYQLEVSGMQSGGSGKTIHDWVANTPCFTRCEMFCEFACLSDWNSSYRRGGRTCQTSRETSCVNCESVQELNPCTVACMRYTQIATIAQRPAAERSQIESTLLIAGPKVEAATPEKGEELTAIEGDVRKGKSGKGYCKFTETYIAQ